MVKQPNCSAVEIAEDYADVAVSVAAILSAVLVENDSC